MRPYTENGTGKTPSKRTHTKRGQKAINGVKKSITKAKVSAVKTKRKIQAGGKNADEVEDLLEQTLNGQPGTPLGAKVMEKVAAKTKVSTAPKQMKKLKSLVKVNGSSSNGSEPTRRSKRLSRKAANGDADDVNVENEDVSMAEEATENGSTSNGTTVKNGGLFQRTISKIWRIPEGITGVPYNDINDSTSSPAASPKKEKANTSSDSKANTSCVIS